MADIVERIIFDDSGATPVIGKLTDAIETLAKEFTDYKQTVQTVAKTTSDEVTKAEKDIQQATKDTVKEQNKAKESILEYAKNYSVFGVSIGGILTKMSEWKTRLLGINQVVKEGTALSKTQVEGVGRLTNVFGGGSKAITLFARGFNILKAAIISTGIGALIIALGSLIAYFTRTQAGVNKLSNAMAYVKTSVGVLFDAFASLGEGIVKAFENPKKAITDFLEGVWKNVTNRFAAVPLLISAVGKAFAALAGRDLKGMKDAISQAGTALVQFGSGLDAEQQKAFADAISNTTKEMNEAANAAVALDKQRQRLEAQAIRLTVREAELRAEINKSKKDAQDTNKTYGERIAAAKRAYDLENGLLQEKLVLQQNIAANIKAEKGLTNSLIADDKEVAEAYAEVARIKAESLEKQTELNNNINTLLTESKEKLKTLTGELFEFAKTYNLISGKEEFEFAKEQQIEMLIKMRKELESISTAFTDEKTTNRIKQEIDIIDQALEAISQREFIPGPPADLKSTWEQAGKDIASGLQLGINANPPTINPTQVPAPEFGNDFFDGIENFQDLYEASLREIFGPSTATIIQESVQALGTFVNEWGNILNEATDIAIGNIDRQLDRISENRETLENELDRELELREKGLANNVDAKKSEVDALLAEEERLNAEKEKLQKEALRRQLAAETAAQAASLITASINIIRGFSYIPIVGQALGVAAVAALFGFFAKTKIDAFNATRLYEGADSIKDHFGFGDYYGDTDLPGKGSGYRLVNERTGRRTNVIISGKEMLLPERISIPNREFFSNMRNGYYDGIDLNEAVLFYTQYKDFDKKGGGNVFNIIATQQSAPKQENHRQYIPFPTKNGGYRAILKTIKPDDKDGSMIEFDF